MSWSSLHDDLWKLIIVHVPLRDRLGSCSRVSKKLCRAAAGATEQLELELSYNAQRYQGVMQWLQHNWQYVTRLGLHDFDAVLAELPCRQLRHLVVGQGGVQLGPSSSHPGAFHSCEGLEKLELLLCDVVDGPDSLTALSATPALQHLDLTGTACPLRTKLLLPGSILQVLTQLTFLSLPDSVEVTAESLQHISALQHLQELSLSMTSVPIDPSTTPGLARLKALHTLKLHHVTLGAAVLQRVTQLQRLELEHGSPAGANGGAVLLSVIGQQSQLQQLKGTGVECQWPTAAAAYTALTASSRLQALTLELDGLPAGVWQAVFRPQHQLPHLQELVLGLWYDREPDDTLHPAAFGSTDISRLVASCPQVQDLDIEELQPAGCAAGSAVTADSPHTPFHPQCIRVICQVSGRPVRAAQFESASQGTFHPTTTAGPNSIEAAHQTGCGAIWSRRLHHSNRRRRQKSAVDLLQSG